MTSKANDPFVPRPDVAPPEIRDLSRRPVALRTEPEISRNQGFRSGRLLRDQRDHILSA